MPGKKKRLTALQLEILVVYCVLLCKRLILQCKYRVNTVTAKEKLRLCALEVTDMLVLDENSEVNIQGERDDVGSRIEEGFTCCNSFQR